MKKINYKSDFDFILRLRDCKEPEKTVPFPECDFDARFWTANKANAYTASCKGGVYTNCFRTEDGGIHFVFDNHRMGMGVLQWEPHFELPNSLYPDSIQDRFSKEPLDIELVPGAGDCPTTSEVEIIAPYIKGDKGDRGDRGEKGEKGDGFTPAQIAKLDALPEAEDLSARIDAAASASFIDLWNAAWGTFGKYDPANAPDAEHPYLGNGIWMTYEEAVNVYNASSNTLNNGYSTNNLYSRIGLRTVLPLRFLADKTDWYQAFYSCRSIEVVAGNFTVYNGTRMFSWCDNLKEIIGSINLSNPNMRVPDMFQMCKSLESVVIKDINGNISFSDSPLLKYESVKGFIDNRSSRYTSPITITVHPAVYAKLTGDTTNAAVAALTDEEAAAWQGLVTAAAAKNISFATV